MEKLKMALEISGIILQAAQVIVLTALTVKLYQYIKQKEGETKGPPSKKRASMEA